MEMKKRGFLIGSFSAMSLGAALMSGAIAQPPATGGIAERIISAKTKADHEQLAADFAKQADADKSSAERHRKMAQAYNTAPWAKASGAAMVNHCKSLISDYEKAAKQNAEMARLHREIGAKLP